MADSWEESCSPDHHSVVSSLTHHCILHAVEGLAPHGISEVLPQSGSHNITSFCKEVARLVHSPERLALLSEEALLPAVVIQNFYSDVMTELQFATAIEKALVDLSNVEGIEVEALHKICWMYYREAKKGEVSFPKWLTRECTYRLWLVFNQCLDDSSQCLMTTVTMNEVLRRLIEMCCYTWSASYGVGGDREFSFPLFLECVTDYFDKFNLNTSLTKEVISDLVDETVHGVLKKGFLEKKGHVRRNWKRRWFILKRTILAYYSTDKKVVKGELVLNAQTKVINIPDKTSRQYLFLVTCGATDKPFTIAADDQKMKQDWMLAIKKAIALARMAEGGQSCSHQERKELEDALSGFFLLKYGTNQPYLQRRDSDLEQIKHHTTKKKFKTIQRMTKAEKAPPTKALGDTEEAESPDDYVQMRPGKQDGSSSSDEEGYCHMERATFISISSGGSTPDSSGKDSILTFSLPLPGHNDITEEVFNPDETENSDKTGSDDIKKAAKKELKDKTDPPKADFEDSLYEECEVEGLRYIPPQRYVDVRSVNDRTDDDSQSDKAKSPKATPTHTVTPSSSSPQDSYLTILPSPKATPPPEDLPSPSRTAIGPPVPPRRSTSPYTARARPSRITSDDPPVPPPRTSTGSSSLTSPIHGPLSPLSPPYRKTSEPQILLSPPGPVIEESMDNYREDVSPLLKKHISAGDIALRKPGPPAKSGPPPKH